MSYTNGLTAEELIYLIANDYYEMSHDKIKIQRDYFMKMCGDWLNHQNSLKELDPHKRDWTYDGCGNKVSKENPNKLY